MSFSIDAHNCLMFLLWSLGFFCRRKGITQAEGEQGGRPLTLPSCPALLDWLSML